MIVRCCIKQFSIQVTRRQIEFASHNSRFSLRLPFRFAMRRSAETGRLRRAARAFGSAGKAPATRTRDEVSRLAPESNRFHDRAFHATD